MSAVPLVLADPTQTTPPPTLCFGMVSLFVSKNASGKTDKTEGSPRLNSAGIFCGPVCTYFSVSILRSLVDLGTALSKRSSVVIFDIFNLHPSAGITDQLQDLVTFLAK